VNSALDKVDRAWYFVTNLESHWRHDGDWRKTLRTGWGHVVELGKVAVDVVLTAAMFVPGVGLGVAALRVGLMAARVRTGLTAVRALSAARGVRAVNLAREAGQVSRMAMTTAKPLEAAKTAAEATTTGAGLFGRLMGSPSGRALVGGVGGVAGQATHDLIMTPAGAQPHGSVLGRYAGAFIGGAVGLGAAGRLGWTLSGAVGGLAGVVTTKGLDWAVTGESPLTRQSLADVVGATLGGAVGGALGKFVFGSSTSFARVFFGTILLVGPTSGAVTHRDVRSIRQHRTMSSSSPRGE
jgi:hypothetical protein